MESRLDRFRPWPFLLRDFLRLRRMTPTIRQTTAIPPNIKPTMAELLSWLDVLDLPTEVSPKYIDELVAIAGLLYPEVVVTTSVPVLDSVELGVLVDVRVVVEVVTGIVVDTVVATVLVTVVVGAAVVATIVVTTACRLNRLMKSIDSEDATVCVRAKK